jgi:hypothetical protein
VASPMVPVAILAITFSVYVAMGIDGPFAGEVPEAPDFSEPEEDRNWLERTFGGVGELLTGLWTGITFFFQFLTFNVPGAPLWVRLPVSTLIIGSLTWSILSMIRGR